MTNAAPVPIYDRLFLLNARCAASIKLLEQLDGLGVFPPHEASYYAAQIEAVRASASQSVTEHLNAMEMKRAAVAERKRTTGEGVLFKSQV